MLFKRTNKIMVETKINNLQNDLMFLQSKLKHTEEEKQQLLNDINELSSKLNKYDSINSNISRHNSKFINI